MKHILALPAILAAAPAAAAPGGPIDTLKLGEWVCELPGDAAGALGERVPAQDFWVINASSYETSAGRGTYLLTGDRVTMTSGPKRGQRFRRGSPSFMRLLDQNGAETTLRCVRAVSNNR